MPGSMICAIHEALTTTLDHLPPLQHQLSPEHRPSQALDLTGTRRRWGKG